MKWIKSHLTIVVCGAVSVTAVALIVMGIIMSTVQETMARDAAVVQSLANARPVNDRVIQQDHKTFDANAKQLDTIQKRLEERGGYQPLHADVFPAINPKNLGAGFLFRTELPKAQRKMVADLNAKQAPTQQEEADEALAMKDQKDRAARAESLGKGATPLTRPAGSGFGVAPGIAPGVAPGAAPGFASGGFTGRGDIERRKGLSPEQLAEEYPDVRLAIRRAREIYCYVGTEEDTFGKWPEVTAASSPQVDAMWYAQMGLWIQQDVVKALAGLNNRVAEGIKTRQQQVWVGNLPVKHVRRITINGYLPWSAAGAAAASPSVTPAAKPSESLPSFSLGCTPDVDVIQFNLDLVVEARMLPSVIDEICKAGFLTPVLVRYEIQPANLSWSGYLYGSAPTLHVSIDFEGSFLRAKYEKWMPPSVKEAITAGQAKFQQGFSSTGGSGPGMVTPRSVPGFGPSGPGSGSLER